MTVVASSENSVQYVPPDGFFGIQTVQNSILVLPIPYPLNALGVEDRCPWHQGPLDFWTVAAPLTASAIFLIHSKSQSAPCWSSISTN